MKFHGQLLQDAWVAEQVFPARRDAYFLDAGAFDGAHFSNTLALERDLGWRGICVEGAAEVIGRLRANRRCIVEHALVAAEVRDRYFLGTRAMTSHASDVPLPGSRAMRSTTLAEILDRHRAPPTIDYLSMDLEGCEGPILLGFPFERYRFGCMSVELTRAGVDAHANLCAHLARFGYRFVGKLFADSFFVHESIEYTLPPDWFENTLARRINPKYWNKPELAHVAWVRAARDEQARLEAELVAQRGRMCAEGSVRSSTLEDTMLPALRDPPPDDPAQCSLAALPFALAEETISPEAFVAEVRRRFPGRVPDEDLLAWGRRQTQVMHAPRWATRSYQQGAETAAALGHSIGALVANLTRALACNAINLAIAELADRRDLDPPPVEAPPVVAVAAPPPEPAAVPVEAAPAAPTDTIATAIDEWCASYFRASRPPRHPPREMRTALVRHLGREPTPAEVGIAERAYEALGVRYLERARSPRLRRAL